MIKVIKYLLVRVDMKNTKMVVDSKVREINIKTSGSINKTTINIDYVIIPWSNSKYFDDDDGK